MKYHPLQKTLDEIGRNEPSQYFMGCKKFLSRYLENKRNQKKFRQRLSSISPCWDDDPSDQTIVPWNKNYEKEFDFVCYDLNKASWNEYGSLMAKYHRLKTGFKPLPVRGSHGNSSKIINDLRMKGAHALGNMLDEGQVKEIREYFSDKEARDNYKPEEGYFSPLDPPSSVEHAHFHGGISVEAPHLIYLANHPKIISAVSNYLGVLPTIEYLIASWSLPGRASPSGPQHFHIDPGPGQFVKLIIYLNDIDINSGPFVYVNNSDRINWRLWENRQQILKDDPNRWKEIENLILWGEGYGNRKSDAEIEGYYGPENITPLTGPAGSTFLANVRGFHKGLKPVDNARLALFVLYTQFPHNPEVESYEEGSGRLPDFIDAMSIR